MCKSIVLVVIFALLGVAILAVGLILGFAVFDILIDDHIRESVRLEYGTDQYNRWKNPPQSTIFKVYFFNVTNSYFVANNGAMPIVEEVGPYVYRKYRTRTNVYFNETLDTLSYSRLEPFQFDAGASEPRSNTDLIKVLNVPMQAVLQMYEMYENISTFDEYWREMFNVADDDNEDTLFHTVTVQDYLFNGYEFCTNETIQPVCDEVLEMFAGSQLFTPTQDGIAFSFFKSKDNVQQDFQILAGIEEIYDVGQILSWNHAKFMNVWVNNNSICNEIRGTDGTLFQPFNNQESSFDVFYNDICRIFNFQFDSEAEFIEINGYRYTLKNDSLSSLSPDSWCHCINITKDLAGENNCLPDGFEDMYGCLGTHIVLSLPHLLGADDVYASTVEGLNSSTELHESYLNLEPQLGMPLTAAKRLQFNMFLRNNSEVTSNVESSVIPILWFEEVNEISEDLADKTINSFLSWTLALEIITWVLIGVGVAVILISILVGAFCGRRTD